ncbi:hypothetical protein LS69_009800 [Helicobacter sp. MIT 05-5294]|nr:hypothetical protein LS69_009800 [Helicobacter sp. MIT 05-5294]
MTLSNYRFYLEEINQDSNNPNHTNTNHSNENLNSNDFNPNHNTTNQESNRLNTNQDSNNANNHLKNHSSNSFNDINQDSNNPNHTNNHTNINHFNANMNTDSNNLNINNHLNPNQDSLAIQANLESKDSTPSTYTLQTILQKDKAYSTLGIELKSPKAIETYNINGNFSIKLTNINLQDIQSQSNNTLTKDSPLFIYIQDYKLNFIAKLKDKQTTIKIPLDTTITKDKYNNINLQDTKLLFLSFIPFKDNDEANNTKAQKIQIESKDLEKQSITKQFKIPIIEDFKENEIIKEWKRESLSNKIIEVYFSYGEECSEVEQYSKCQDDMNLHIIVEDYKVS